MTDLAAAIVATTHHPLLVLDDALRIKLANPAFCAVFGVAREDAEGRPLAVVGGGVLDANGLHEQLRALLDGGQDVRAHRLEGTLLVHARRLVADEPLLLVTLEEASSAVDGELLLAELNHRVKNTLAVVQGIASQTLARSRTLDEFGEAFRGRLEALARGHDHLVAAEWRAADLQDVVAGVVGTFREDHRIRAEGPTVHLTTRMVLALTLVLHELETNATKYGALSEEDGRVHITWDLNPDGTVQMTWSEHEGPPVEPPGRRGFGTRLIEELVAYELDGEARLDFRPDGLRADVTFQISSEPSDPLRGGRGMTR